VASHGTTSAATSSSHFIPVHSTQVLFSLRVLPCTTLVPWLSVVLVAPVATCPSYTYNAAVAFSALIIAIIMILLPVAVFAAMLKEFLSESQGSSAFRLRFGRESEFQTFIRVCTCIVMYMRRVGNY
jgi:hypothetical protein